MDREENIIELKNVSFVYGSIDDPDSHDIKKVLSNVSLSIERGSFTSILGRNGSGKSTLAKCMNGLFVPSAGDVFVDGMNTADDSVIYEIRRTVGMVFQNPDNQIVASVVEDDVAFGPENLGVPEDEIRSRIDRAMRAVGIYEYRERSLAGLSGGQKQRVAIAGVLAMEPECIIFDESTSMLDPKGRKDILNIILDLKEKGITVILITHFMEEAVRSDRIIVMDGGRVVLTGTPAGIFSVANRDRVLAAGLALPPAVRMRDIIFSDSCGEDIVDIDGLVNAVSSFLEEVVT